MKELTPQEALQAIADGKKLEYRWKHDDEWETFNPLCNGIIIDCVLAGDCVFRLAQEMITIGDVSFPKPESEPLEVGTEYWVTALAYPHYSSTNSFCWDDDSDDKKYLQRGLVHLNRENAVAHSKALIKLSGGKVNAE